MKKYAYAISLMMIKILCISQNTSLFMGNFIKNETTTLPMSYRNGANPIIQVKINGKGPYKFMFDTGSPGVAKLDEALFKSLNLSIKDSIIADDGSRLNARSFPIVNLQSIEIGDYKISNVDAMVRNYNGRQGIDSIDGVIGLSFFKNVTVELNFEENKLTISKNRLDKKDVNVYPMKLINDIVTMPMEIGGKTLETVFDTGNMGWISLHSSNVTKEIFIGEPKVVGRAKTVNNEFEIKEAKLNQNIVLGNLVFEKPVVIINDIIPRTNAGIKFLKQMNITFDIENQYVKIIKFTPKHYENKESVFNEYIGEYGDRIVTLDPNGSLCIQRPNGILLKMVNKNKDEFGLEIAPNAIIIFERDAQNIIRSINVNRGDGVWEKAIKLDKQIINNREN